MAGVVVAGVVDPGVVVAGAAGGAAVAGVPAPNTNAFSCSVARIDGKRFSLSPNVTVSTLKRRPSASSAPFRMLTRFRSRKRKSERL